MKDLGLHKNLLNEIIYGTLDIDLYKMLVTHDDDCRLKNEKCSPLFSDYTKIVTK